MMSVTAVCCDNMQPTLCLFCLLLSLGRPVATATHLGDPLDPLTSLPTETLDLSGRTAIELSRVRVFLTLWSQNKKIPFNVEVILI